LRIDAYRAALIVVVFLAVSVATLDYYGFYPEPLSQVADVVTAGAATWFAALELEQYGVEETIPHRASWLLFSIGIGCRLTSEVIYQFYDAVGNPVPVPSVGTTFSLAGYTMVVLGMLLYVRHFLRTLTLTKLVAIVVTVVTVAVAAVVLLLTPKGLAAVSASNVEALAVLYTVTHFLALTAAFLGFAVFAATGESRAWLAMIGAALSTLVADLIFSYAFINAAYGVLPADNCVTAMSYTLFALAFQLHRREFGQRPAIH